MHLVFTNKRSLEYYPYAHTHTLQKKNKKKTTATSYTLCDVNTEDTIRHNIALMTSDI